MQFREIRALLNEQFMATTSGNKFEGNSDKKDRRSYFQQARTIVFKEHELLKS